MIDRRIDRAVCNKAKVKKDKRRRGRDVPAALSTWGLDRKESVNTRGLILCDGRQRDVRGSGAANSWKEIFEPRWAKVFLVMEVVKQACEIATLPRQPRRGRPFAYGGGMR